MPFVMLDAVVCVVVSVVFEWYWGVGLFVFAMLCVWIGATVSAPIKQRNQARTLLLSKLTPIPLTNRHELISAIHRLKEAARETIWRNDILKTKHEARNASDYEQALGDYSTAYETYDEAEKQLECEISVAGEAFRRPITSFQNTFKLYVLSREISNPSEYTEILAKLSDAVNEVVREIEAISQ